MKRSFHALLQFLLICLVSDAVPNGGHADILYVSNTMYNNESDKIVRFDSRGAGSAFVDANGPGTPRGIAFDSTGNLFAIQNANVYKYNSNGVSTPFGSYGFFSDNGCAFDRTGNLFVASPITGEILKYTPDGVASVFANNVGAPFGLAFDRSGTLYAACMGNDAIETFTPEGVPSFFAIGGLLSAPYGLAFNSAGDLYVSNQGGGINKFTPDGIGSVFVSTGLNVPEGLAVDSHDNVYVADYGDNTIKKFTPAGVGSIFARGGVLNQPLYLAFTDDNGVPLILPRKAPGTVTLSNLIQTFDGSAKSVSATTAPPGLTVQATYNGSVDAPTNPGNYIVIGTISDANYFGSTTNTLQIGVAPAIDSQPVSHTSNLGTPTTFSVTAEGTASLFYQWMKDGTNCANGNGSVLTLTSVQKIDEGSYSVAISNAFGSILSAGAQLKVNLSPVADASATSPLAISANGINAAVTLNGSHSFDPDGGSLQYTWFNTGESNALATGAVALATLPLGTNAITLVVSDGLASESQTITLEVITVGQAIRQLIGVVKTVPAKQSLLPSLRAAFESINRGQPGLAANQLRAFQHEVKARSGRIGSVTAQTLHDQAQVIIDALTKTQINRERLLQSDGAPF